MNYDSFSTTPDTSRERAVDDERPILLQRYRKRLAGVTLSLTQSTGTLDRNYIDQSRIEVLGRDQTSVDVRLG